MEIELSKLVGFTDSLQLPMPETRETLLNKGLIHKSCGQAYSYKQNKYKAYFLPVLDNGVSK